MSRLSSNACAAPCILRRGHAGWHRDCNAVEFGWQILGPSGKWWPVPIVDPFDDVADADFEVWEEEHADWVAKGSPCADV